jgi:predicted transglutaminase-like protease
MKYKQNTHYQSLNGIGPRDCIERWNVIRKYVSYDTSSVSIDVGSAEGVFVKNIVNETGGRVISIEGSEFVYNIQKKYCSTEIDQGRVILHNMKLTNDSLKTLYLSNIDYCLLLSVLHWLDDPDFILESLSNISKFVFIELPDLTDTKCYNTQYLKYIKSKYDTVDRYLTTITGKKILGAYHVAAHTSKYRTLYVLN